MGIEGKSMNGMNILSGQYWFVQQVCRAEKEKKNTATLRRQKERDCAQSGTKFEEILIRTMEVESIM
ncbi:MAG: hypothetical protein E7277_03990 [Lachnospiraceae bacterium]|jgi:hypothetical protein|nr:hypothetical protein [Lachnospiraceae bacterium]